MSESLRNGWDDESDEADDLTAGDVFERLKDDEDATSADSEAVYRELVDESPEDLAEAADEPPTEEAGATARDDDILADDDALEDLLLPDRTEEDGFLWIDVGSDGGADSGAGQAIEGDRDGDGAEDEYEDEDRAPPQDRNADDEHGTGDADEIPAPVDDWMVDFAATADDDPGVVAGAAEESARPSAEDEDGDKDRDEGGERGQEEPEATHEEPSLPIVDEDPESIAIAAPEENDPADSNLGVAGRFVRRVKRLVRGLF